MFILRKASDRLLDGFPLIQGLEPELGPGLVTGLVIGTLGGSFLFRSTIPGPAKDTEDTGTRVEPSPSPSLGEVSSGEVSPKSILSPPLPRRFRRKKKKRARRRRDRKITAPIVAPTIVPTGIVLEEGEEEEPIA